MKLARNPIRKMPIASCSTAAIRARRRVSDRYVSVPGSAIGETDAKVRSAMRAGGPTGMWREVPNRA
jgi:hypothetical protein